jgi:hypothetical protein
LLTSTIPTELGLLSSLEYVTLAGNRLTGSVPSGLCRLRDWSGENLVVDCVDVACDCNCFCGDAPDDYATDADAAPQADGPKR